MLRLAGAVEDASGHPIAVAIAAGARDRLGTSLPGVEGFTSHDGLGVSGVADGHAVVAGRQDWIKTEWAQPIPASLAARADEAEAAGQTAVFAGWDGQVRGVLVVADTIKPTSAEAVARLRRMGLEPVLLTGDNDRAARAVAGQAGIGEVIAGVLPAGKAAAISRLQDAGRVVAMAGDGVNDAAALAQADLGLAMGTGTDAAIEAADITLVRGDLLAAPDAIRLSRRTLRTIKGNLFWAFAYNTAAIPLAALGFLNPLISAAAMAFSSVFVVSNSLRLRHFHPCRCPTLRPPAAAGGRRAAGATAPNPALAGARKCPRSSGWLLAVWLAGPPVSELLQCGGLRRTCERDLLLPQPLRRAHRPGRASGHQRPADPGRRHPLRGRPPPAAPSTRRPAGSRPVGPAAIGEPSPASRGPAPYVRRPPDTGLFRNPGHHH